MRGRTFLRHRCHFCGHLSRYVEFIVGDSNWQCVNRNVCQRRRDSKLVFRYGLDFPQWIGPLDGAFGKVAGLWSEESR